MCRIRFTRLLSVTLLRPLSSSSSWVDFQSSLSLSRYIYIYIYIRNAYRTTRACRRARRQNCQLKSGSEAEPCVINTGAAQRATPPGGSGAPYRTFTRPPRPKYPSPVATSLRCLSRYPRPSLYAAETRRNDRNIYVIERAQSTVGWTRARGSKRIQTRTNTHTHACV